MRYPFKTLSAYPFLVVLLLSLFGLPGLTFAQDDSASQGKILFILDGSGSMWGQIENKPKIAIAKDVMSHLIQELPDNIQAGLQVYGHRSKGDCNDIELLSPIGHSDKTTLIQQIQAIQPKGKTPITRSFEIAAEHLREAEDETTAVLISDGKETCAGDPCTLVRALRNQGVKVKVHVVGFDVNKEERNQLHCIAEAGGGKYFNAKNTRQLTQALVEVKQEVLKKAETKEAPEPQDNKKKKKVIKLQTLSAISIPNLSGHRVEIYDQQSGNKVGDITAKARTLEVPAGTYKLRFYSHYLEGVEVGSGQTTELLLGAISIPNLSGHKVEVYDQQSDSKVGDIMVEARTLEVPAGTYKLRFYSHYLEGVEVGPEQSTEVLLGAISMPNLSGRKIEVYGQQSGSKVGEITVDTKTLEVPVGTYKLRFGNQYQEGIVVGANEEIVLE